LIKRLFDLVFSLIGLVVFSPVMLLIAAVIKITSPGPILYKGIRIGQFGKPFRLLKFRTMVMDADKIGGPSTAADDPRVTKIGRVLRKYKADELPQLFNVLTAEMSFVGPRPEVPAEVALYSPQQRALLRLPPGITDWASMRFHNEGEILKGSTNPHQTYQEKIRPEKIRLGLEYVEKRSFWIDMQILFSTVALIVKTRTNSQASICNTQPRL